MDYIGVVHWLLSDHKPEHLVERTSQGGTQKSWRVADLTLEVSHRCRTVYNVTKPTAGHACPYCRAKPPSGVSGRPTCNNACHVTNKSGRQGVLVLRNISIHRVADDRNCRNCGTSHTLGEIFGAAHYHIVTSPTEHVHVLPQI